VSSYLRRSIVGGAAMVIALSGLAACGSDDSGGGGGGSSSSKSKIKAACKLDNPPTSKAEAPKEGTAGKASGKAGVILPGHHVLDAVHALRRTAPDQVPQGWWTHARRAERPGREEQVLLDRAEHDR
jgi:hypothetical protein